MPAMSIAKGQAHDDDSEPIIEIGKEELGDIPRAEEALDILIPIAKRCYRLLKAAAPDLDDAAYSTRLCHSADVAWQVLQQEYRVGAVDLEALVARIDLPGIADTLPLLIEAYKRCAPLWGLRHGEDPGYILLLLFLIGMKMWPDCGENFHVAGYGDIFPPDASSPPPPEAIEASRDDPHRIENMPNFEEALGILKPIVEQVAELLGEAAPGLDDRTAFQHHFRGAHCALQVVQQQDRSVAVDMDAVISKIDAPAIADTMPLLIEGFERCRPLWKGTTRADWRDEIPSPELMNTMSVLLYIGAEMYLTGGAFEMVGGMSPHDLFDYPGASPLEK